MPNPTMDTSSTTTIPKSLFRPFPLPLSGRQWFYLTFLQGVGAGFIDGGANFGIAYASESPFHVVHTKLAANDSVSQSISRKDVGV
jgi:hypothetical protein